MDKQALFTLVKERLEAILKNAVDSANRAHDGATDTESVAENKYDTRGLEAAYLAEGQTKRVQACEQDLRDFTVMSAEFTEDKLSVQQIALGSLVKVVLETDEEKWLLLSPVAGGVKVHWSDQEVMLVTPSAPLGKAMLGLAESDEFVVAVGVDKKHYFIEAVH